MTLAPVAAGRSISDVVCENLRTEKKCSERRARRLSPDPLLRKTGERTLLFVISASGSYSTVVAARQIEHDPFLARSELNQRLNRV